MVFGVLFTGHVLVQCLRVSERGHRYRRPSTRASNIRILYFPCFLIHPTGQVLLTVGTGERVHHLGDLKLLPLHSYAIISM